MNRLITFLSIVAISVFLAACGSDNKQTQDANQTTTTTTGNRKTRTEEKREVQQKEIRFLSPNEKITKAKALLEEAKAELAQKGKYSCCIKETCNSCAFDHQNCGCYTSLKAGKPVCNDCYAGWQRGDGVDKDIKKEQVKTSYTGHKH